MSYMAIISRIHTRPLPGADKLLIGSCGAYQVIVGKDVQDGDLGAFFESDGQLSEEFAKQNDLIRRKNEDGTPAGGMFEENRRVKAIKLRGARSEGFWCPLRLLAYTGHDLSKLKEGDQFCELNGKPICNKYVTQATQQSSIGKLSRPQKDNRMFAKHIDTGMFKREMQLIPDDSILYITEKLHGTSFRLAHVIDETPINRKWPMTWIAKILGFPSATKEWKHLIGSRNVILQNRNGDGFYGKEEFRYRCVEGIALRKGEVIYGEIVGHTESNSPIMSQDTECLKDKSIIGKYGKKMDYSYGCHVGQCDIYVYRITQVNEDAIAAELSWQQVKHRCKELGIKHVPETYRPLFMANISKEELFKIVSDQTEQSESQPHPSMIDERHIREGVVVRCESSHGTTWLKNKAYVFGMLEGYIKDSPEYIDEEEAS